MKALLSTFSMLLLFLAVLFFASLFSTKVANYGEVASNILVSDRVFNKFISVEHAILRILEEQAGFGGIKITITENNFNFVTFEEVLPRRTISDFQTDLKNLEKFGNTKLNETNLVVNLNFTDLKCLPLVIQPYNISYLHIPSTNCLQVSAQTRVVIDPENSWQYLNAYTLTFKPNGAIQGATVDGWGGPGCNKGTLKLNITIVGTDTTYGPSATTTLYEKMCRFNIDNIACPGGLGFVHVIHNQNSKEADRGVFDIEVHPNCNITTIVTLNLTDIPGKVRVSLPPESIKVKETLYQIEKNDTVYIN